MIEQARQAVQVLRDAGHKSFFAGGYVRDIIMGREIHDVDITTSATPEEVMRLFPAHKAVGAHFGVVIVTVDGQQFETATFRTDGSYSDGRRPDSVAYTTDEREDVARRDFTINGLLYDPLGDKTFDYVGGMEDLKDGVIRAIGDPNQRFREDKLRMLRAVRFAVTLDFNIEENTRLAILNNAHDISIVAPERVNQELVKMLLANPYRSILLLNKTGLLQYILPEVCLMKGVEQPAEFHPEGDVWAHTLMMLSELPTNSSLELILGTLLHDVGKYHTRGFHDGRITFRQHAEVGAAMARDMLNRLKFPTNVTEQVVSLVENHMVWHSAKSLKLSTLKRYMRLNNFSEHYELNRLDSMCSTKDLSNYEFLKEKFQEFGMAQVKPKRLVTGNDLIALGFKPGPEMGCILRELEDMQLNGALTTREEALELARKNYG